MSTAFGDDEAFVPAIKPGQYNLEHGLRVGLLLVFYGVSMKMLDTNTGKHGLEPDGWRVAELRFGITLIPNSLKDALAVADRAMLQYSDTLEHGDLDTVNAALTELGAWLDSAR